MIAVLLAASLAAGGTVQLELPPQLVLEPLSVEEVAGGAAIPWEGGTVPPLGVVVRRVSGAFRLLLPRGVAPASFEVRAQVRELGNPGKEGGRVPVKVTVLPLRLVESRGELEVWEADLLFHLDLSRASAGTLSGRLEVLVVGR